MTPLHRTRFEVAATDNGWIVTREGLGRDSTHATKDAAIQRAVKLARSKKPSELMIRRQDGSVQEVRNYSLALPG